jgi:hypothetical protein
MKNLIYYPSFEPKDLTWIKYALIYIDSVAPIIPISGRSSLSPQFRKLEEVQLVVPFEPHWKDGDNASTKIIKEIELIQKHPEQYRDKLDSVNAPRTWSDRKNQTYKLFEEKFNMPFRDYCIDNGLALRCPGGILIAKELGYLYMTILANEIAFTKNTSIITDNHKLDMLSTYLRAKDVDLENRMFATNTVIDEYLPKKIENIDIDRFIEFRKKSEIEGLRLEFNKSLDGFYSGIENGFDVNKYVEKTNSANISLRNEIGLFFGGLISTGLGALILINQQDTSALEGAKQIVEGTALTIGGVIAINESWKLGDNRRKARKFLTKVSNI